MITLYLMSKKGFYVLSEIIKTFGTSKISAVVSEKDSGVTEDFYEEIKNLCSDYSIPFFNRKDDFNTTSLFSIAISWRWLIKNAQTLIVVHDSLLPQYRGFNPLVTALINGDNVVGVTAIFADEEFDTGNIIYKSSVSVEYPITIGEAIEKINVCNKEVILKICSDILQNRPLPSIPQDHLLSTYSLWRDEKDYRIDWSLSSAKIKRIIDATGSPYKGAEAIVENECIKISEAEVTEDFNISNRDVGKVIMIKQGIPYVVCGMGILKILAMKDKDGNEFVLKKTRVRFE